MHASSGRRRRKPSLASATKSQRCRDKYADNRSSQNYTESSSHRNRPRSTANLVHRPIGSHEVVGANAMRGGLCTDAVAYELGNFIVRAAAAQKGAGIPFTRREQTITDLAFCGEPQPVAIAAEWLRHWMNNADFPAAVAKPEIDRRLAGMRRLHRNERSELNFQPT